MLLHFRNTCLLIGSLEMTDSIWNFLLLCLLDLQACEGEIAFLKSQHQEVGNALLEREKDFQALMLKNKELKKTIIALVSWRLLKGIINLKYWFTCLPICLSHIHWWNSLVTKICQYHSEIMWQVILTMKLEKILNTCGVFIYEKFNCPDFSHTKIFYFIYLFIYTFFFLGASYNCYQLFWLKILLQEKAKLLHQKKPDQCSGGCDAARALEAQLKECSSRLEKEKVKSQEAENRAEEAVREASSLEKTLLEKTQEEGEKAAMEDHIQELSFKITKLEEELQTSTKKFQDLKDQVCILFFESDALKFMHWLITDT